jgi:glycosyltransferase involved in cell wall biosynthesis
MLVEFILPTFDRYLPIKSALASLTAQTDGDWGAHVVIDDVKNDKMVEVVTSFNDSRICHSFMDKRYNDWGHTPREKGKQMSKARYIIMTGDDNYYTPNFVAELRTIVQGNPGMVYWDMVHSHFGYTFFQCVPAVGRIDMGAFATRKDLAHQIKMGTDFAADGWFVENFKRKFPKEAIVKIHKVLFVHN